MHSTIPEAAELATELRRLRAARGNPTLSAISNATHRYVSIATLSRLFSGKALPTWTAVTLTARVLTDEDGVQKVEDLYARARAARRRVRPLAADRRPRQRPGQLAGVRTELSQFQDRLRALVASTGLSVRDLSRRAGIPRSTIGDALSHPRPPQLRVVGAIAKACGAQAGPWMRAARAVLISSDEPAAAASQAEAVPRPRTEPGAPADEEQPAVAATFSASDILIQAAVTRAPAEIAALVVRLRAGGDTVLAERLLQAAAKQRTVEDIAAMALALLETEQSVPGTEHTDAEEPSSSPPLSDPSLSPKSAQRAEWRQRRREASRIRRGLG